jgi:hypothetical protein
MRASFTETVMIWAFIAILAFAAIHFGPAIVGHAMAHETGRPSANATTLVRNLNPFDTLARALHQ